MIKDVLDINLNERLLRLKAESVYFDGKGELPIGTRRLIESMIDTLKVNNAQGLAAPQVNETLRIIVVDGKPAPLVLIDPVIVERSSKLATHEESCLSIPGFSTEIDRPARVVVRFFTPERVETRIEADGWGAACLQHEIDHLDGVLVIDRASRLKREMFRKHLAKARRGGVPEKHARGVGAR